MANDGLCYQAYAGPAPASALHRRRRVGDYRILYAFNDAEVWALVVHVAHRGRAYRGL